MVVACDGSELVLRFSPFSPAKLLENAEDTYDDDERHRRPAPRYGVSVIAGRCEDGETVEDAVARICTKTGLSGGKKIAVATGNMLRSAGFEVVEDPTGEEPLHHLVGEDPFTERPDTAKMAEVLSTKLNNPKWKAS